MMNLRLILMGVQNKCGDTKVAFLLENTIDTWYKSTYVAFHLKYDSYSIDTFRLCSKGESECVSVQRMHLFHIKTYLLLCLWLCLFPDFPIFWRCYYSIHRKSFTYKKINLVRYWKFVHTLYYISSIYWDELCSNVLICRTETNLNMTLYVDFWG